MCLVTFGGHNFVKKVLAIKKLVLRKRRSTSTSYTMSHFVLSVEGHLGMRRNCFCNISRILGCTWPLLLFEQPTFMSVNYVCARVVGLSLMMELASLMFFKILILF